jgi:hypothetical protein
VVNNNIVLIDTFNYVRAQHPELNVPEAIVRAGAAPAPGHADHGDHGLRPAAPGL